MECKYFFKPTDTIALASNRRASFTDVVLESLCQNYSLKDIWEA